MRRLRVWRAMPPVERRAALKGVVLNPLMLGLLRRRGTRNAVAVVHRCSARPFEARRRTPDHELVPLARQIGSGVNRAAADPAPAVTCLARSLTAQLLIRRRGIDAKLCIGVGEADAGISGAEGSGGVAFHAWVEVAGVPVNDVVDIAERFAPFPLKQFDVASQP